MTISVIGRAMIATSITAAVRFVKLRPDKKTGDNEIPTQRRISRSTARRPSQRARRQSGDERARRSSASASMPSGSGGAIDPPMEIRRSSTAAGPQ
jgi:hypothetical protein